jgi:signal transduction histidine kinase
MGKDRIGLMVEDTGIGMSEEVLKKIFIPFFTTKDVGQGTGLGLPVVHGIVTSHGGSIKVWSKVNQGTRFEIQLPVKGRDEREREDEHVTSS